MKRISPAPDSSQCGRQPDRPQAFTLIEVLIALGLTVLLLTAVYGAIDLHYRFATAGRGEMARSQLFRAIIRRMDQDVSSIVLALPRDAEMSSDDAAAEGTITTSSSANQDPLAGLAENGSIAPFGVVGGADFLHLVISLPSRDLTYSDAINGRISDLVILSYGLGPVSTDYWKIAESPPGAQRPMTGLGRRIADLYSPEAVPDVLTAEDVISPEITNIQFRYFDGVVWVDSWDSRATGTVPRAIEATFGFWNEPYQPRGSRGRISRPGTVTDVLHVFTVPLSSPATGEASL